MFQLISWSNGWKLSARVVKTRKLVSSQAARPSEQEEKLRRMFFFLLDYSKKLGSETTEAFKRRLPEHASDDEHTHPH